MRTFGLVSLALSRSSPWVCGLRRRWRNSPLPKFRPSMSSNQSNPGSVVLPAEDLTVGVTRFSFIAYGDTRGQADGRELQRDHGRIVDAMIEAIQSRASTPFPVRFIVHSGDAVTSGVAAEQWNVSFTPLIERLTREGQVPYFVAAGNHDTTARPLGDPLRQLALRTTLAATSRLNPAEGSPRRLDGYPTFAFGYGNAFVVALDSNVAADPLQLAWVADQLQSIDRARYRHVIAVFHHPPFSSGPHGGPIVEPQTEAIRRLYLPLFRRHHVRMTITGHDHFYEHWTERYADGAGEHRFDHLVTGGGGAPIYTYRGEPDLTDYLATAKPLKLEPEHVVRPGRTDADNPHHFVVIQVDGDELSLEVIGIGPNPYRPYGTARVDLVDRKS